MKELKPETWNRYNKIYLCEDHVREYFNMNRDTRIYADQCRLCDHGNCSKIAVWKVSPDSRRYSVGSKLDNTIKE